LLLDREQLKDQLQSTIKFSGRSDASGNININSDIQMQTWAAFYKYKVDLRVSNPNPNYIDMTVARINPKWFKDLTIYAFQNETRDGFEYTTYPLKKGKNTLNVRANGFRSNIDVTITLTMFFEDTNIIKLTDDVLNKAKSDPQINNKNVVCCAISDKLIEFLIKGIIFYQSNEVGFDFEIPTTTTIMKAYLKRQIVDTDPDPIQVHILSDKKYIQIIFRIYLGFRLKTSNDEYAIVESEFKVNIIPEMRKHASELLKIKATDAELTFNKITLRKDAIINQQFPPTPTNPNTSTNPIPVFTATVQNILGNIKNVTDISVNYSTIIPNFIQFVEFPDAWNRTEDFLVFFEKFYWEKGLVEGIESGYLFPVFTVKGLTDICQCSDKKDLNIQSITPSQNFPTYDYSFKWFAFAFSQESLNEIANPMVNKLNKHQQKKISTTVWPIYAEGEYDYYLQVKLNKITIIENGLYFDFDFASVEGKITINAKDKAVGHKFGPWYISLTVSIENVSDLTTIEIEEFKESEIVGKWEPPKINHFIRLYTKHNLSIGKITANVDTNTPIEISAANWVLNHLLNYIESSPYMWFIQLDINSQLNKRPYLIIYSQDSYARMTKLGYVDTIFNENSSLILLGALNTED